MHPVTIIGSGLAGYTLAKEFRKLDQTTPLRIITRDAGIFYSKPQLSSAFTHQKPAAALASASASKMAEQLHAEILTHTTVKKINAAQQQIETEQATLSYSALVLAQGAEVIKIPLAGDAANEVLSVNSLEDYQNFRTQIADKKRVTILGAGLVGCEFTNDLLNGGHHVDVVALAKTPLDILLPAELGKIFEQQLQEKGVVWHLERSIQSVKHGNNGLDVLLSDNSVLQTDLVLSAIGLRPALQLAKTAELATQRGILVDRYLCTTNPAIYALGDCAEVAGHVMFYVAPLVICARALAQTLTGNPTPVSYPPMPVILKTPACPVVVNPPPNNIRGTWQISGDAPDKKALFYDEQNCLQGFALLGKSVLEKMALVKELPILF